MSTYVNFALICLLLVALMILSACYQEMVIDINILEYQVEKLLVEVQNLKDLKGD